MSFDQVFDRKMITYFIHFKRIYPLYIQSYRESKTTEGKREKKHDFDTSEAHQQH